MGIFWAYFRDTLRLPFIQRPGPLAMLAEGAAPLLDAVRDAILLLRDQFLVSRCEEGYLNNFARSHGLVRAPQESDESWTGRVQLSYLWWARGGRAGLMAQVLVDHFGFASVEIINMRASDAARWAEFKVVAYVIGGNLMFTTAQVEWAINEVKPARSKLASIEYIYSVEGNVPAYSFGATSAEIVTVYPEPE